MFDIYKMGISTKDFIFHDTNKIWVFDNFIV